MKKFSLAAICCMLAVCFTACVKESDHGVINGHEYVDLGLPSGVKWATCNVGADKPEGYGDYFAWGEVEAKNEYSWETYKWSLMEQHVAKYCTNETYGTNDGKLVLSAEDDAASVLWGGSWRIPTKEEQDELQKLCTWKWTTKNHVKGYKVIGPNGNSIFLPAAGCRYINDISDADVCGYYWSSTLGEDIPLLAYDLYFGDNFKNWSSYYRYFGRSIRAVTK